MADDDLLKRDQDLLRRIQGGDAAAEEELFNAYNRVVIREAELSGLGSADADEVAVAVLYRALGEAQAGKLRPGTLRGWLKTVAKNAAIDRLRQLRREREGLGAVAEEYEFARGGGEEKTRVVVGYQEMVVLCALRRLEERERERSEDWSYVQVLEWVGRDIEIAEMSKWMGTKDATTRKRKERALDLLKEEAEAVIASGEIAREKK